ncbi:leukocyte elastase inhibitor-like [Centruroides sculpturatus]|uniref:leukocyte elastase inhibitor-like n=1 Tax=Centruroides sculpturatus TaxID=218467 RepID=UPI000C6D10D8|nr:leukocyte elastase inhibitor-like [Centruroides sculpturatus]XP_023213222.1 leukocyte elastase inhibitor-like [Centruroides sculpturatus]XP_023213223.1 leukocyte elastase inhibitor-like [Centruroides sculpturatus]
MDAAVISSNSLGCKLLLEQRKENCRENIFFSPLSISVALSMLYAGTKGNTKKQMEEVLGLKEDDRQIHEQFRAIFKSLCSEKDDLVFNNVNLLAADSSYNILPDFVDGLRSNYSVDIKKYNFGDESERARSEINKFIEEATRSKIKDLLSPSSIQASTRLVLANAIYFKGMWRLPFDRNETSKKPFYAINNEQKMVNMMFREEDYNHMFSEELNASFLEIPYSGKKYSMVIILPKEKNGLSNLENNISLESVNKEIGMMRKEKVLLYLPRFKLEENLPLKNLLIQLGMVDVFNSSADLSGIGGNKDLYVSDALHKAFVEVNEEGTEAAAATALPMFLCYIPPVNFVVDRPFMFIIRETSSGLILFIGSVYNIS